MPNSASTPAVSEPFDICESKNVYEPCPQCKSSIGMGMTSGLTGGDQPASRMSQFVMCICCGHKGPAVAIPDEEGGFELLGNVQAERDRETFNAWNEAARRAAAAAAG